MKIKRDRKGIRVPGIRNRLNGDDSWGMYALMDWYCQGHLTFEDVLRRTQKYIRLYQNLESFGDIGRTRLPHHDEQFRRVHTKMMTLIMVLHSWSERKFS